MNEDNEKFYVAICQHCGAMVFAATPRLVREQSTTRCDITRLLKQGLSVERATGDEIKDRFRPHSDGCQFSKKRKNTKRLAMNG